MIFFLATRTEDPLPAPAAVHVPGYSIGTYAIPLITILPSTAILHTSTSTLLAREIDPDEDLAGCWRQILFSCLSAYIYTILNFTLSVTHIIPQLLVVLCNKSGSGLSIISLGLQIPMLFLLGLVVGRRFNRDFKSERGSRPEFKTTSDISNRQFARGIVFLLSLKRAATWYLCGGNAAGGVWRYGGGTGGIVCSLPALWYYR
jgi:hypothetical protein